MTMRSVGAFLVFVLTCNVSVHGRCFRPTAAFTYGGATYLIDGNDYVTLDENFRQLKAGKMEATFGLPGDLKAAGVFTFSKAPFFNVDNLMFRYSRFTKKVRRPDEGKDWGSFFEDGIDAASKFNGHDYYFKGCKYIKDMEGDDEFDIRSLGIPACGVDAAFSRDGSMYLLKAGVYWVVKEDKDKGIQTQGPKPLRDLATMTTTELCQGRR